MLEYEYCSTCNSDTISFPSKAKAYIQWRSEGNWRPGAKLNFAPPPLKKFLKNDIEMSIVFN